MPRKKTPKVTIDNLQEPVAHVGTPFVVSPVPDKSTIYFYWLKAQTYISDTERLEAGVYAFKQAIERLKNASPKDVEVFEDEIPEQKLKELAKRYYAKDTQDVLKRFVIYK
jgi:hypothetical protein